MPIPLPPFKAWLASNIPSVFDNTLSYYEELTKLIAYLEQVVVPAVNENDEKLEELEAAFAELKSYVDHYFDNLDVQTEINNKLDQMVLDGTLGTIINQVVQPTITELNENYQEFTDEINSDVEQIRNLVDSAVGQTPIVVSNVSDMTDQSKVYVLTTDGKWYYWNGAAWVAGGTYQATAISANSVEKYMTRFRKASGRNLFDWTTASVVNVNATANPMTTNSACHVVYIPIKHNTTYTVSKVLSARFAVCLTTDIPANGVISSGLTIDNTATSITINSGNSAEYLCVQYFITGVSETLTEEQIRKSITIVESNQETYPDSQPYYALSIGTDDLNTGVVTASKTDFCRTSENAYDYENPNILYGYFNGTTTTITANGNMRIVYVPCKANTTYTIVKPSDSARFSVGYSANEPAIGVAMQGIIHQDSSHSIVLTTGSDSEYIAVFLCNTTVMNFADAVEGLMIYEGTAPNYYVAHKVIDVKTENIRDGAVTKEKLASSVLGDNYLSSRSKVYGISYDITDDDTTVNRIADATGLKADFVIGDDYQLNGGVNDFDNIYPWSDMRLCNVRFDENGKKIITYSNEASFTRDGSNGEVMVEIPKFYSFRQRIGNIETWAISGEKKAGFEVEPLFKTSNGELDYAYIGAYDGCGDSVESKTGTMPQVNETIASYISQYNAKHLNTYDITAFFAIQKLMMIEFATRNLQNYFGGITNQSYMRQTATLNPDGVIKAIDTNQVSIQPDESERCKYYFVGQKIKFGQQGHGDECNYDNSRTITAISYDSDTGYVVINYDGTDLSDTIEVDTWGVYGMPQISGLTDNLPYHTGRTNFATAGTNTSKRNLNNAFKYRNIENIYGNVWERTASVIVKNLQAYINYDPDKIDLTTGNWVSNGVSLPLQTTAGHTPASWIVEESYNRELPLIALPSKIGSSNGGGDNKFFSDSFYSNSQTDVNYYSVTGGGWDHYVFAGAFTIRMYESINSAFWLYGNRPTIRK